MAHILLAEDDSSMCKFLAMALKRAGHTVTAKNNGLEALATLSDSSTKDKNPPYELLLTDIVMPGMDGIELAQSATKIYPELKVMFITGFAAVAMGQQNSSKHETKILSKPFHLNELISQINTLLKAS